MTSSDCIEFLQWALPRMGLRWEGFRRVRRQVCRRVGRRVQALHLPDFRAYRAYIDAHAEEWQVLDSLCHISISRFVRDRAVFDWLATEVLPALATDAIARDASAIRCWSAGCASGEEPYSLAMLWTFELSAAFPALRLTVLGTDVDDHLIERARQAEYRKSSLREVPNSWIANAFDRSGHSYVVRSQLRGMVEFRRQDLRTELPHEEFDLILCRNLAFTYFDEHLQLETLRRLRSVLRPGGGLVIGRREKLPSATDDLPAWSSELSVYRRARLP